MDKELLRKVVYITIAIIVSIIAVKLFIWLLPIILIAFLALYIYSAMESSNNKNKKTKDNNKKKIIIIDEEKDN